LGAKAATEKKKPSKGDDSDLKSEKGGLQGKATPKKKSKK